MVRPANFPDEAPGTGMRIIKINDIKLAIINLQGRSFMQDIDDPFKKADQLIEEAQKSTPYIFVDFHAETTSEKKCYGLVFRWQSERCCWYSYTYSNF